MSFLVPGPRRRGMDIEHVVDGRRSAGIDSIAERQTSPRSSLRREIASGTPSCGGGSVSGIRAGGSVALEAFDSSQKASALGGSISVQIPRPGVRTIARQSSPSPTTMCRQLAALCHRAENLAAPSYPSRATVGPSRLRRQMCPVSPRGQVPVQRRHSTSPRRGSTHLPVPTRFVSSPSPDSWQPPSARITSSIEACRVPPIGYQLRDSWQPPPDARATSSGHARATSTVGRQGGSSPPVAPHESWSDTPWYSQTMPWPLSARTADGGRHQRWPLSSSCSQGQQAVGASPRIAGGSGASVVTGPQRGTSSPWTWHHGQAPMYTKGEQVQVCSNTNKSWFVGTIEEAFHTDCVFDGYDIRAGTLIVKYANSMKYVLPEDVDTYVRKMPADDATVFKVPASLQALAEEQQRAEENVRLDTLLRTTVEVLSLEAGYMEDGCLEPLSSPASAHMSAPETPERTSEVQASTGSECKDEYTWADVLPLREVPAATLPQDDDTASASPATSPPNDDYTSLIEAKAEPTLRLLTMEDVRQRHEGGRTLFYIALSLA